MVSDRPSSTVRAAKPMLKSLPTDIHVHSGWGCMSLTVMVEEVNADKGSYQRRRAHRESTPTIAEMFSGESFSAHGRTPAGSAQSRQNNGRLARAMFIPRILHLLQSTVQFQDDEGCSSKGVHRADTVAAAARARARARGLDGENAAGTSPDRRFGPSAASGKRPYMWGVLASARARRVNHDLHPPQLASIQQQQRLRRQPQTSCQEMNTATAAAITVHAVRTARVLLRFSYKAAMFCQYFTCTLFAIRRPNECEGHNQTRLEQQHRSQFHVSTCVVPEQRVIPTVLAALITICVLSILPDR